MTVWAIMEGPQSIYRIGRAHPVPNIRGGLERAGELRVYVFFALLFTFEYHIVLRCGGIQITNRYISLHFASLYLRLAGY